MMTESIEREISICGCGTEPEYKQDYCGIVMHLVECPKCKAYSAECHSKDKVIEKWNSNMRIASIICENLRK